MYEKFILKSRLRWNKIRESLNSTVSIRFDKLIDFHAQFFSVPVQTSHIPSLFTIIVFGCVSANGILIETI